MSSLREIQDQDLVLQCQVCGHVFVEYITLPMDMTAFTDRMNAYTRCPHCGEKPRRNSKQGIVLLVGEKRSEAVAKLMSDA